MAAHAALAARNQGNYEAFHWALMEADGPFDLDHILAVARSVGLDDERLARDMEEPAPGCVDRAERRARQRPRHRAGTPAFVIGDQLIGGAIPLEQFRAVIADARQALTEGTGAQ